MITINTAKCKQVVKLLYLIHKDLLDVTNLSLSDSDKVILRKALNMMDNERSYMAGLLTLNQKEISLE